MPITDTIYAARNLAFAPTLEIEYLGGPLPLTGATVSMQIRQYPGQAGAVLAEDASVTFEDEGAETEAEPDLRVLRLFPSISKATLAALAGLHQPEIGDSQTFYQEIKATYADDAQDSLWIGEFILSPGVNAA